MIALKNIVSSPIAAIAYISNIISIAPSISNTQQLINKKGRERNIRGLLPVSYHPSRIDSHINRIAGLAVVFVGFAELDIDLDLFGVACGGWGDGYVG